MTLSIILANISYLKFIVHRYRWSKWINHGLIPRALLFCAALGNTVNNLGSHGTYEI